MSAYFKVVWPDGKESGPATLEDLRAWRLEGAIRDSTLVYSSTTRRWQELSEVAELAKRVPPTSLRGPHGTNLEDSAIPSSSGISGLDRGLRSSASDTVGELLSVPPATVSRTAPPVPRLGAALFLAVACASSILMFQGNHEASGRWGRLLLLVLDVLISIGLFRRSSFLALRSQQWRLLGAIRLGAGVTYFGLTQPAESWRFLAPYLVLGWVFVIVAVTALLIRLRKTWVVVAGTALLSGAVLVTLASGGWWPFQRLSFGSAVLNVASSSREFLDSEAGMKLGLYTGWYEVPLDWAGGRQPSARAAFAHPETGQVAVLFRERPPFSLFRGVENPLRVYLDQVVRKRKLERPGETDRFRLTVRCGDFPGERAELAGPEWGRGWTAFESVFSDGWWLWRLSSEPRFETPGNQAIKAYGSLEGSFYPARDRKAKLREAISVDFGSIPLGSEELVDVLVDAVWERAFSAQGPLDFELLGSAALLLLPREETQEVQELQARAFASLPQEKRQELDAILERIRTRTMTWTRESQARYLSLYAEALRGLTRDESSRLRELFCAGVRKALIASRPSDAAE